MKLLCLLVAVCGVLVADEAKLDGHKVYYEASGKGSPALVMVHGWTCDLTFFAPQVAELSKTYRVLAIDLPGHGKSDKPEITYDGKLFARAVLAAMDAAKIDKAVLIGHSMGLPVIRNVYAEAPARVVGLISIDGAVFTGTMGDFPESMRGAEGMNVRRKMVGTMFVASTPEALRKEIEAKMLVAPDYVAVSAMRDGVPSPLWKEPVGVPALAIQQKRNNSTTVRKHFEDAFTQLDYREMENVGHFLHLEKPAEVNRMILDWVKGK
ncbi:MAG: alpha/beta hydrolase [Bryobacteraceae bacterium]|nr:alpha/beta hydrolase [Bryobacteraceae bacterium]